MSINSVFKIFKTKKNHYLYDTNSNKIFEINNTIYDLIETGQTDNVTIVDQKTIEKLSKIYTKEDLFKEIEVLKKCIYEEQCLSSNIPEISFDIDSIETLYNSCTRQLILEVTQNCNQRCKYCVYSGRYFYNKRIHSENDMPLNVAQRSIDFFLDRIPEHFNDDCSLSLYGGEPLLKWDLIKEIIKYANGKKRNKDISINFTTNATLLSTEVIHYLIKNDIHLTISLDGPQHIHDRYRVYRNGKGTFYSLMKNLRKIREYSSEYFKNNINYVIILAPPCNFEEIKNFFYRNPFFVSNLNSYNFSQVDIYNTSFFSEFNLMKDELKRVRDIANLKNIYKEYLIEGKYQQLTFEKKFFDSDFHRIHFREMTPLGDSYPIHGYCYPGLRKLFVDVHGNFFMCERVGNNYEIGDIESGIDFDKIGKFLSKSEEFFADCQTCWALRLCSKCFNSIRKGDIFDELTKARFCEISRANIEENLEYYCEIRENNINAFEPLKHIVYA